MRPVEIIAFLMAALGLVKLVTVVTKPKAWLTVVKKYYANPQGTAAGGAIAALIILYFLLKEISIVQIFAAMAFMMALMTVGMAFFSPELLEFSEKMLKQKKVINRTWPAIIIWIVLIAWVLMAIF